VTNNGTGQYLTIKQVVEYLHVSRQTIYNWINEGKLNPVFTPTGKKRFLLNDLVLSRPPSFLYEIVDISQYEKNTQEPTGQKEKYWFSRSNGNWYWDFEGSEYLFKVGRPGSGENWAEVIACELCQLLKLPHAEYKLARYKDKLGVITPSFVPHGAALILGNEMLHLVVKDYKSEIRYHQQKHTLSRVMTAIGKDTQFPVGWQPLEGIETAHDIFTGYLLLDAWIANTDRHHENWGVIRDIATNTFHLAPTFDHASSLGSHENDSNKQDRLNTNDKFRNVAAYVRRAHSALFKNENEQKAMLTIEAFREMAIRYKKAANIWLENMDNINTQEVLHILEQIPEVVMSNTSKLFTQAILEENKKRLMTLDI
jgi:excisionase family DNA binding protein